MPHTVPTAVNTTPTSCQNPVGIRVLGMALAKSVGVELAKEKPTNNNIMKRTLKKVFMRTSLKKILYSTPGECYIKPLKFYIV